MPPEDGSGMPMKVNVPNEPTSASDSTGRYEARSSIVSGPPERCTLSTIRRAIGPR